jgi:hypothetical protein
LLLKGDAVFRNHPRAARVLPRLLYQLVPAALVTTVGVLLLSSLAKAPEIPLVTAPVETAINAEAVFKIVPRETAEAPAEANPEGKRVAASRTPVHPKPLATRKAANESASARQVASVAAPLPIVPEQPQPAATLPDSENGAMSKLRNAATAVQQLPQWAVRSVAGWFSSDAPPRPPASVPQNFQAAM